MTSKELILEKEGPIAVLTLNRPDKLNAISPNIRVDFPQALQEVQDDDNLRALIITGAGRGFCSGADVAVQAARAAGQQLETSRKSILQLIGAFMLGFEKINKPVIAAVNGIAAGVGLTLALACDIRMGSEKARFKVGFISRGSIPVAGGSWFLPRIVGMHKAFEYAFTDRFIEAGEAEKLGLLNHVFPPQDLESETKKFANQIAKNPPVAVKLAKLFIRKGLNIDLDSILEFVAPTKFLAFSTEDHRESVAAFREKREPSYRGR